MTILPTQRWRSKATGQPVEVIEAKNGSVRYRIAGLVIVATEFRFKQQYELAEGGREG